MKMDITYEAECGHCEMITTAKAIRATKWAEEYDGPCGYCGNILRMKIIDTKESEAEESR